jgi:hypothetical protein
MNGRCSNGGLGQGGIYRHSNVWSVPVTQVEMGEGNRFRVGDEIRSSMLNFVTKRMV